MREGRPTRPAVPALALRALLVGGSAELVSLRRGVQASRAKKRVPWSGLQGQVRSRSRCEASGWGRGPGGRGGVRPTAKGRAPALRVSSRTVATCRRCRQACDRVRLRERSCCSVRKGGMRPPRPSSRLSRGPRQQASRAKPGVQWRGRPRPSARCSEHVGIGAGRIRRPTRSWRESCGSRRGHESRADRGPAVRWSAHSGDGAREGVAGGARNTDSRLRVTCTHTHRHVCADPGSVFAETESCAVSLLFVMDVGGS